MAQPNQAIPCFGSFTTKVGEAKRPYTYASPQKRTIGQTSP